MKAIILAAGEGSRLRPYTNFKPKCMVKLAGKSLLQRQLEVLRSSGIDQIVLVGGYRADRLDVDGVELVINPRFFETNMVSTLFCAESWMTSGEDILITYGDIIYEQRVLRTLIETNAPIAISVDKDWLRLWESRMDDPLSDAETLKLKAENQIVELGKKPKQLDEIQGQYMGLIKVRGDTVNAFRAEWHGLDRNAVYDDKDFDNMYMTSFIQHLINAGYDVRAAFTNNGWIEIDTAEDLEFYEQKQQSGELSDFIRLMG